MSDPRISIISASYNQGEYIEYAIQSVLAQNYPDFEHIIIDGGSTDGTLDILKKYSHLKWVSEPDEGQSDAINKGFRMASGDIIGWLNTDDYYLPGSFWLVARAFDENETDAVYGDYRIVDSKLKIIKELRTQNPSFWMSVFYCHIPSETLFFRREIINSGIMVDKTLDISMDKDFVSHMLFSGYKITRIDAFLAHFRLHENNKSNNSKGVIIREGLTIFNRYSGFRLPKNIFGYAVYWFIVKLTTVYRVISRVFKIWVYSRK